jgi:hypothetical protein
MSESVGSYPLSNVHHDDDVGFISNERYLGTVRASNRLLLVLCIQIICRPEGSKSANLIVLFMKSNEITGSKVRSAATCELERATPDQNCLRERLQQPGRR